MTLTYAFCDIKKRKKSIFETRTAYELTHNRGGGYLLVADGQEIVDELQQAVRFGIFGAVLRYRREDDLCMGTQHGELNV